jgi:hypothetical protein
VLLLVQAAAWLLFFMFCPFLFVLLGTGSTRQAWYAQKQYFIVWALLAIPSLVYLVTLGLSKVIP